MYALLIYNANLRVSEPIIELNQYCIKYYETVAVSKLKQVLRD